MIGNVEKPVVISGPSGVGKGTLISMLTKEFPSMFGESHNPCSKMYGERWSPFSFY